MLRLWLIIGMLSLVSASHLPSEIDTEALSLSDAVSWLEKAAHRLIRASRRSMEDGTSAFPPQVGIGYETFRLRDFEYNLESSMISYSDEELTAACRQLGELLLAAGRADESHKLGAESMRGASPGRHPRHA